MAFSPTPKNPGDLVRSQDWNEAMDEIVRLEAAKVNTTGGNINGTLSVSTLNVGTSEPPSRALTVRGTAGTYLNVIANNGTHEILLGADNAGGIVSTMTNHDLQLRAGGNVTRLTVKADGKVGIGTLSPAEPLEVNGRIKSGALTIGPWPANPNGYMFLGTNALNQADAGNYALLQGAAADPGVTFLNSPANIRFRIRNVDKMVLANNGQLQILADSNSIHFTAGWSAFPDAVTHRAEISNDTGGFKTLMIVGNRSAGLGRRVSVWDRFEVNGTFVNNSSIEAKQDVHALSEEDYRDIHNKLVQTPLYRYRFKASGIDQKSRLGVISEESPSEILDETGKYVSFLDYVGFLFAALKAQAREINRLAMLIGANAKNDGAIANEPV
jgi:hypothetical protein